MTCKTGSGAVYGLGFLGVLIYYLQQSKTLAEILFGILKAIVWPALLTYRLFGFLKI